MAGGVGSERSDRDGARSVGMRQSVARASAAEGPCTLASRRRADAGGGAFDDAGRFGDAVDRSRASVVHAAANRSATAARASARGPGPRRIVSREVEG